MSTIRSSAVINRVYSGFTADIWWRPTAVGAQQRIISIGVSGSSAVLYVEQTAAGALTVGDATDTTTMHSGVVANRLYHITITYDRGAISYRVASKIVWATGTATWTAKSIAALTSYFAIGSTHHNTPTFPATGHLLKVFFAPRWIAAATSSTVYGIFEQTSGNDTGEMILHSPITALGTTPDVYFGPTQTAAEWAAGTNRGSIAFGAATGTALTDIGLAKTLTRPANPIIRTPQCSDGSYLYTAYIGQAIRRYALDRSSYAVLMTQSKTDWKKADGVTPITGNDGYYAFYRTASGFLVQVLDSGGAIRRFYRSTSASFDADPVNDIKPVLSIGSNGTTGINGTEVSGRNALGLSTYVVGTFNGAPALYFGEYEAAGAPSKCGTIWYSVDDGASWAVFWRYSNAGHTPPLWRYCHGVVQLDDGRLAVIMNGVSTTDSAIVIGPTTATWSDIDDATTATIQANGTYTVLKQADDTFRWIQATTFNGLLVGGNEQNHGSDSVRGMYAVSQTGLTGSSTATRTHRRANMLIGPPDLEAHPGGGIRNLNGLLVASDYVGPYDSQSPTTVLEVRTSLDGLFWVPVAKINLLDTHPLCHVWSTFAVSTELYMGGTYEGYQASGSTPGAHVVTAGTWTGRTESLTVLNQ